MISRSVNKVIGCFFADSGAAKSTRCAAIYKRTVIFIAAHLKALLLLLVVKNECNILCATMRQQKDKFDNHYPASAIASSIIF